MLDILSSPLKGYLAQTLQYYLSKYLKDIHLEGLGIFGSDLVLNDLEIKRHVLQTALDIPSTFDFSRGFIRELRIHIPWTQILSQPIEIKLYTVELILVAKDQQPTTRPRRNSNGSECSSLTYNSKQIDPDSAQQQMEPPKSSWLQSMLSKILANISIQINNLVLKYEQNDIVLSLTLGLLDVYSANEERNWAKGYEEPKGDHKTISKRVDAKDISIFMDRYTSDRLSMDPDSDIIHRQVIGYEVPVLRRTSFSIHLQFALQPSAFPRQDKLAKPYISSPFTDPFQGNAVEGPALVVVNIYVKELNFSLSDRQVQMLIDVTIVATSKQRSVQQNDNTEQYQSAVPPSPSPKIAPKPTSQPPPPPENSTSWSSWAMGVLVGSEAPYEDELEQELLKGIADQTPPPPPAEEAERVDEANLSTLHLVVVRVSIQRASLTLRCHDNNADDQVDIPTEMLPIEFVPVANMGLVQVAAHSKTKISKAATPIAILHVQDALVSWCTNQIVRDLAIDIAGLSTVEATPDGRQLLVAGSFDAPRSQDLEKGRQLVVVEGESYWQPLFGEIEMPIADNCMCHDASYNLPSIVDFWESTLEKFKQAQPKAWETRILEVIESKFKWPRKRLQSIERLLSELSHAYDQNPIWNHILPFLVLSTAQFANHSCCSRVTNSAIRLRLVENDDTTSSQMDMSFGTININVSTSSIAIGDAFVSRLTLPSQRTSTELVEPTDSTDTIDRRFVVHVSHATALCSTDDGPFASVHVANCLVSIDQSAKKQSIVLVVGNLGGMVSNVDVVEITSAHAAFTWSLTSPECIDHCAFEAAINQIKVQWNLTIGIDLLNRIVPAILGAANLHPTLMEVFSQIEWNDTASHDTFTATLGLLSSQLMLGKIVDGIDGNCNVSIGSLAAFRHRPKAIRHFFQTEKTPWIYAQSTINTQVISGRTLDVLDVLEILGLINRHQKPPSSYQAADGTINVHAAGFQVDWRDCVALMTLMPMSTKQHPVESKQSVSQPMTQIKLWTVQANLSCAVSRWILSSHLTLCTPQMIVQTEPPPSTVPSANHLNVRVILSDWGLIHGESRVAWIHEITATLALIHETLGHAKHSVELDVAVAIKKIQMKLSPYHVVLMQFVPVLHQTPNETSASTTPDHERSIAWCIKGGVQLVHLLVEVDAPSIQLQLNVHNVSAAWLVGNFPPLQAIVAPFDEIYLDTQLLIHEVSLHEEKTLTHGCWLLHGLPTSTLLSILMHLNPDDVSAFAEAVGIADIDQAKLVNPLVFWQFLSSLLQQATSNPPPQQVALQPILCTLHSFAPLSYENVVLSLFGRNYGNPPYDGFFHGYMEAVDIFLSLPALSALVSFAIPIAKLFPPSKSLEKSNEKLFQPHVNFQMEPLRVIFPDGMIVCVEGVHVDTLPFVDFSMEGLRSPPFTPLTKKAKANRPTVYPDSGIKMIGRINNLYAVVTSWTLSSDNDPSLGPYEIGLARLKSQPCILLTKVDYVLRPLLVSVESTAQISLHMTKMSVDLPYHRFLNILNKVDEIIGVIPKNWPESPPRIVEKSQALGCRIALDGFELNLINDKTSIHTRVGSVAFSHSLPPTDQGSFSIKNIVIGFRDGSSSSEEMLICGPFADPTEWQLAVEKYPDQIISATWSIQAGMLTGLVELQGVQCHVSPQFVNSLVAFIKPLVRHETPQRSTRDFTLQRFDPRTNVPVLGFIQQSKIKLLGAPSVVTLESPDAQIAAVLTLGSIFASLHVGYDSTEVNSVAKMGHSALHQYLPLKYMDYMCTVQTLRMQMLRGYTSLNVPLVAKFNRPDWSDFERAWTKRQQVPLIDDVQVRLTGDVNQVLLPFEMQVMDGAYLIDMQIETTPIESALCFETWSILDSLVRNVQENIESSASVSQHVEDKYEQEPSVELSPPTANDFMELDQSLQPRQHPSSGELVFLGEIDQDDKADIPPMMRVMNSVSEDFESLLHCVNEPWESCSSSPASLRWKMHILQSERFMYHGKNHFEKNQEVHLHPRYEVGLPTIQMKTKENDYSNRRLPRGNSSHLSLLHINGSCVGECQMEQSLSDVSNWGVTDLTEVSMSCAVPHVQLTLLRGQQVLHDVASIKIENIGLYWRAGASSLRVAGDLSGELQNMVTLSSIPILPRVQLQLCHQAKRSGETSVALQSSPFHVHLSQYAIKCLLELPYLFTKTRQDLSDMRILIRNGIGHTVYFRQHGTSEKRSVDAHDSVVYSWQSIESPFQLEFALTSALKWSLGCDLNQPGVQYRDCDDLGSFWVQISSEGVQTIVTLRASIVMHNYIDHKLFCRLGQTSTAVPLEPCTKMGDCVCTDASVMVRNNARLSMGVASGSEIVWSTIQSVFPPTELLEPSATTENVSTATFVSIPCRPRPLYFWLVVKRVVSPVLQHGVVNCVDRFTWLEVSVWPVLQLYNSLAQLVQIEIIDKTTRVSENKTLDPSSRWLMTSYSPFKEHTFIVSQQNRGKIVEFEVPRFVSTENDDVPSYPSSAIQMDLPDAGFLCISRHSSDIPTRDISMQPHFRLRNDLPVDLIVQPNPDDTSLHVKVPANSEHYIPFRTFVIGVKPHTVLVWSKELAWNDVVQRVVWMFRVQDSTVDHLVEAAIRCHSNPLPCQTRSMTIAPRFLVVNSSEWALKVKPPSNGSNTPALDLWQGASWWLWNLDETALSGRSTLTSGLAWIRHRLSSDAAKAPLSFSLSAAGLEWSYDITVESKVSRRRIVLPHPQNRHLLVTMHTILAGDSTILTLSHDLQPPVIFQNQINCCLGAALDSTPIMIGANYALEYDWAIQSSVLQPGMESVFENKPDPSIRFRLCHADSWSNALWMAEGIQFAKWSGLVVLLTIFKRAGTWIVRMECIEGPYTNVAPMALPRQRKHHVRIDIALNEVILSLFDENHLDHHAYAEICRLSAKQLHLSILSSDQTIPETAKPRFRRGYFDYLEGFSTYWVHVESLELMHLFPDCNFPVILSSTPQNKIHSQKTDTALLAKYIPLTGALSARVILTNPTPESHTVPHLHAVDLAIAPLVIQVEDTLIRKVILWLAPLQSALAFEEATSTPSMPVVQPKIFIERLSIRPIVLTITAQALYGLDRTPLTFSAVELTQVFCPADQLIKDVAANYVADALVNSPMVLMSLNCFGNPAGFFRDMSTGVQDLVRLPLVAITEEGYNPYSVTKGVLQGTASFFTHASVAALTSVSGVALAISRSMDHLALPEPRRPQLIPSTFASGLSNGLESLGSSVVGAATGVIRTPLTVYRDNQAHGKDTGLGAGILGVGKGLVGIVAQPMGGVASLVSMTSQGLLVEMGFGPIHPSALRMAVVRHAKLHVRWKILADKDIPGDIEFADADYLDQDNSTRVLLVVSPTHHLVKSQPWNKVW
ncbi:hypothetical protein Ae201684P_012680 [Aphanomyces euteiches]|nr:hypothetical protein Ae201684P_012680 [Aphanomyces euteiches]